MLLKFKLTPCSNCSPWTIHHGLSTANAYGSILLQLFYRKAVCCQDAVRIPICIDENHCGRVGFGKQVIQFWISKLLVFECYVVIPAFIAKQSHMSSYYL